MHAAYGATHIWAAAVVAGLAVVLTGTIAFSSVQAKSERDIAALRNDSLTSDDLSRVMEKLAQVESDLNNVKTLCAPHAASGSASTTNP